MTDPERVRSAIRARDLSVEPPDWAAHLSCCASPKEAEAVRLVLMEGFLPFQAGQMMECSARDIRKYLRRFQRKVLRCEAEFAPMYKGRSAWERRDTEPGSQAKVEGTTS